MVHRLIAFIALEFLPDQLRQPDQDSKDLRTSWEKIQGPDHDVGTSLKCCVLMRCLEFCPASLESNADFDNLLAIFQRATPQHATRSASKMPADATVFFCCSQAVDICRNELDSDHFRMLKDRVTDASNGWAHFRKRVAEGLLPKERLEQLVQHFKCITRLDGLFSSKAAELTSVALLNQISLAREAEQYLKENASVVRSIAARGVEASLLLRKFERAATGCVADLTSAKKRTEDWLEPLQAHMDFYQYFSAGQDSSTSRSVLFIHFLEKEVSRLECESLGTVDLACALERVRSLLRTLLEGCAANFNELKEAGEKLRKVGQSPDAELRVIARFYDDGSGVQAQVDRTINGLRSILQLTQLAGLVLVLVTTLERYKFLCATSKDDEAFDALTQIGYKLNDEKQMSDSTMGVCETLRNDIHVRLWARQDELGNVPDDEHRICIGLLQLFSRLASADRVWNFVLEQKCFAADGRVSDTFHKRLHFLQQQVSGAADENLLNQLGSAVRFVSILAAVRHRPLHEIISTLRADEHVMREARSADDAFLQLKELQKHMSRLEEWYTKGVALPHGFSVASVCCSSHTFALMQVLVVWTPCLLSSSAWRSLESSCCT